MSFNIIHFIVIGIVLVIFVLGVIASINNGKKKLILPMIFSVTLMSVLIGSIGIAVVEKYTKKVKLIKLQNRRYLTQEKISYFGFVKNTGKYPLAKVYLHVKLVNAGHATGNVKGGNFYKNSGFADFFSKGADILYKPQTVEKDFVVARNVKPGEVIPFRVTFPYPPYFKNTADFVKVSAH